MKQNIIRPTGLKGQEKVNRMLELMGQTMIKENVDRSVIELTKIGPDGKVYGIVRENHEYYIKIAESTQNLTKDSFKYIGGLKNKKDFVYPSYAKAIKHLNYKFKSLDEAFGTKSNINVFENDMLVSEHHPYKADQKLSATKGMGDGAEYVVDKKGKELSFDSKEGKAEDGFGDNVAEKDVMDELEEVKLSENEERIDQMITGKVTPKIVISEDDVRVAKPLSILRGMEVIDDAIAKATGEYKLNEMATATELLKKFSKDEVISILESVTGKKKVLAEGKISFGELDFENITNTNDLAWAARKVGNCVIEFVEDTHTGSKFYRLYDKENMNSYYYARTAYDKVQGTTLKFTTEQEGYQHDFEVINRPWGGNPELKKKV
jgi:hypothetical protein